ncbi:hypothetical protein ACFLSF_04700, partial [Candidatus Bipolaricaulota bacterium]
GHLKNLLTLCLSSNLISDITPLSGLASLEWLALGDNYIDNIAPLRSMNGLAVLMLPRNLITDCAPLMDINLRRLVLGSGPMDAPYPKAITEALAERGVHVGFTDDCREMLQEDYEEQIHRTLFGE